MSFQATDLPDTTVGQDLWQYSYSLSGFSFQTGQGFTVFFDSLLYSDLQNPQPNPSSDWSVIAVQPDTTLTVPGFFDAQALVNSPSLATTFSIQFIWLGHGQPTEQSVDIYDLNFATIASLETVASSGGGGGTVVPDNPNRVLSLSLVLVVAMSNLSRRRRMRPAA